MAAVDVSTGSRGQVGLDQPRTGGVVLLSLAIAAIGFTGIAISGWNFDLGIPLTDPIFWLLAGAFLISESFGVHLTFKSQRHTYSLSEIPTVIGLFYLQPAELITACLIGSLVAYVLRRIEPLKLTFNTSLQFAMVVVQLLVFEAIATSRAPTEATAIMGAFAAVLLTSFLSHLAVDAAITLVTRAHSGTLFWLGLWLAVATQLANVSVGLAAVLLTAINKAAIFILLTPVVVMFFAYRSLAKRVAAEEKVRLSEQRVAALIRASPDVSALIGNDGELHYVSDAAIEVLGIEPATVLGRPARELFDSSDTDIERFVTARREAAASTEPVLFDLVTRNRKGEKLQLEIHIVNLTTEQSGDALLMTIRDVTDRRKLEESLVQSQKMDAVGQLAGGIAHDFNNLLAVIQNYAAFIKSDIAPDSGAAQDLAEIQRATDAASALTRQLLSFARNEFVPASVVDINELVARLHRMLRRTIHASIEVRTSLDPDLSNVRVDPGRLEQVLMNLAVNAKDALPEGGQITFRTFETEIGATTSSGLEPGSYVVIAVEDTGTGIEPEVQRRIFDPFFTTKPKGAGTGLGLATAYGIVKQFKGHIEVDSRPGVGTTFRVYLPATTEEAATDETPQVAPAIALTCTVLVAEDSEPLRRLIERLLTKNSYEVLSAGTGLEAFELWQQHATKIDLLVTDVVMPKMSGKELSELTGLPTVLMSGYTDQIVSHDLNPDGTVLLPKPFTETELLTSIANALDEKTLARPTPTTRRAG